MRQLVRRNALGAARYAPYARLAMRAGSAVGKFIKNRYSRPAQRGRSSRGASYGNLTFQNDESTIYRRKRAPKRVRRRQRRAMGNFMYRMDKLQSMKTAIVTDRALISTTPTGVSNGQVCAGITMYGFGINSYGSNANTANGDMGWIFARENGGYPTSTDATRKLRFRSCVMEITISNDLTADGAGDVHGILIFDIYYVIARKNGSGGTSGSSTSGNPELFWSECLNAEGAGNMPTAITADSQLGITPFDASQFGRYWLIKKKRRVRLSPGQYHQFQMRDPGNYTIQMEDLLNIRWKSNLTEGVVIVGQNAGYKFDSGSGTYIPGDVEYAVTYRKTYHYTEVFSSVETIGT